MHLVAAVDRCLLPKAIHVKASCADVTATRTFAPARNTPADTLSRTSILLARPGRENDEEEEEEEFEEEEEEEEGSKRDEEVNEVEGSMSSAEALKNELLL